MKDEYYRMTISSTDYADLNPAQDIVVMCIEEGWELDGPIIRGSVFPTIEINLKIRKGFPDD